jgi:DNA-binding MarR family transcriptional regulator
MAKPTEKMLQQTIDRFWETVPPTWIRVRTHVRSVATENFGVTLEQFHILRHLRKGRQSVSQLAIAQQISRPAISQAVEALVVKGLITRQARAGDRRFVDVELTPKGTALINAIFQKNREWMFAKMESLSQAEIGKLVEAMELLKKTFDESAN